MRKERDAVKFKLIVDKERDEEVVVYAKEETPLIKEIESLVKGKNEALIGYLDGAAINVSIKDVFCFTIEKNKIYAIMESEKLLIKQRLYQIENRELPDFIKINQSTLANIKKIDRFKVSIGGSLIVLFKNGYRDYVSRRQLKFVKERMGVK